MNNKDHTKSRRVIARGGTRDPRVMSSKKVARKKANSLQKEDYCHLRFVKDHVDKPEGNWQNVLWMDETKIELSAWMRSVMFDDEQTLHSNIRTLSHL